MKRLFLILAVLMLAVPTLKAEEEAGFDPGSMIIGHVTDAHSWHMFDYTSADGTEHAVAIPLPVILWNDGRLDVFSSAKFHHGHADYRGYRLVGGGAEKEEIVCVDEAGNPTGAKPLDLSITKTAAAIMIAAVLLIVIVFIARAGYKKRPNQAPKGLQSLVEMLVVFVRDSIAHPMIGEGKYQRYLPYLLTLFFFIFLCNILGLIPFFPALLDRHLQHPRRSRLAQGVPPDAGCRAGWCFHQAYSAYDPTLRQSDCRSYCDTRFHCHHFHPQQPVRYGRRWCSKRGQRALQRFYLATRMSGGLHPGLCVHHAHRPIHRYGRCRTASCRINPIKPQ